MEEQLFQEKFCTFVKDVPGLNRKRPEKNKKKSKLLIFLDLQKF